MSRSRREASEHDGCAKLGKLWPEPHRLKMPPTRR